MAIPQRKLVLKKNKVAYSPYKSSVFRACLHDCSVLCLIKATEGSRIRLEGGHALGALAMMHAFFILCPSPGNPHL